MAIEIFPTSDDVGGSGTGRSASEKNMIQGIYPAEAQSTILSGMTPGVGAGLAMSIANGRCLIDGYICRLEDIESFTVTDDATKYVWLQLTGADSYGVTSAAFVETDNLTAPTSSALVSKVVSSGGDIDEVDDSARREGFGQVCGTYTGDTDAGSQDIDLGATPRYVTARNTATGNTFHSSFSNIHPGDRELEASPIRVTTILNTTGADDVQWSNDETDGGLRIIKDGFRADKYMNLNTYTYLYIAWF
tara:strand:+ start:669 stop:1412 length:744 start_codon:yes stop_codon:yes gene_type:complete